MIHLNDQELEIAKLLGRARQCANEEKDNTSLKVDEDETDTTCNVIGMAGELAFCKLFNVYPDTRVFPRMRNPKFNCILNNMKIDVRTTRTSHGLIVPVYKLLTDFDEVDLLAGMRCVTPVTFVFLGFVTPERFFKHCEKTYFGPRQQGWTVPTYCLRSAEVPA